VATVYTCVLYECCGLVMILRMVLHSASVEALQLLSVRKLLIGWGARPVSVWTFFRT
jgi:hypothetical protein